MKELQSSIWSVMTIECTTCKSTQKESQINYCDIEDASMRFWNMGWRKLDELILCPKCSGAPDKYALTSASE